jgi:[ribosomal protein S5]-alanine N-acetyltransferase
VSDQPTLETERLRLRPFTLADAADVQRLAGAREIASTTLLIPHPYEDGMAEEWISGQAELFRRGKQACFAVTRRDDGALVGSVTLTINAPHRRAEMGYWIGLPFWGMGYGTEAARATLGYAFGELGLARVHAHHLTRNPSSGRVLQKIGMRHEGTLPRHYNKWGVLEDIEHWGVLASDWRD